MIKRFVLSESNRRSAAYLRGKEEEYRQRGCFLKYFYDKTRGLPLRQEGKVTRARYLVAAKIDTVELVDVRQRKKRQNEQEQPPVPCIDVTANVI